MLLYLKPVLHIDWRVSTIERRKLHIFDKNIAHFLAKRILLAILTMKYERSWSASLVFAHRKAEFPGGLHIDWRVRTHSAHRLAGQNPFRTWTGGSEPVSHIDWRVLSPNLHTHWRNPPNSYTYNGGIFQNSHIGRRKLKALMHIEWRNLLEILHICWRVLLKQMHIEWRFIGFYSPMYMIYIALLSVIVRDQFKCSARNFGVMLNPLEY